SFLNDPTTTDISTLSLHDALPIYFAHAVPAPDGADHALGFHINAFGGDGNGIEDLAPHHFHAARVIEFHAEEENGEPAIEAGDRSEEHTSELQSPCNLVCRLLLEK